MVSIDNNSLGPKPEKKPAIENIPEATRKKILAFTIFIIMVIIIGLWLNSFASKLNRLTDKPTDDSWQGIKQNFSNLLKNTGENFKAVKENFNPPSEPTTTINLAPEELEKLKQKLLEKSEN